MTSAFLPKFRRQLFDWLQLRVNDGRLPFRRVEETPPLLTDGGLATPDLVLWINRDSLLAGAMLLIPAKIDAPLLEHGCEMAASLGLRQFVTWEAREVVLWENGSLAVQRLKSWSLPDARTVSATDFAVTFEQLLQELKNQAVAAVLSPEQLPPAYFANLCRQTLQDIEPVLQEAARIAARPGQPDGGILQSAGDKGWLTLWRLLTLLQQEQLPPGIRPDRLDRALGYALADLDPQNDRQLAPAADEPPLPEAAAIRFHHLAGRLKQLGWRRQPERARCFLEQLFAAAAREYRLETTPLQEPPAGGDLLVNYFPPQPPDGSTLVAPQACLAGWRLASPEAEPGAHLFTELTALPGDLRPLRITAALHESLPLTAAQRRRRLASLRQPWPYRRLRLPGDTPTWLWDALHLGGLADSEGQLQLTLPPAWPAAPGAEPFWRLVRERRALAALQIHADGRQTLTLPGLDQAPDVLTIRHPDGTARELPPLPEEAELSTVAALASAVTVPAPLLQRHRKTQPALADEIDARVFSDGVPHFPEHYLRRIDRPPLRSYRLPGPLQIDSYFFDRIRLTGPNGTCVDSTNAAEAEALVLASRDGRAQVELPIDPALTMRLTAAYRDDLRRLWQELLDECRRHHPLQRQALALARRLWRARQLPSQEPS